MEGWWLDLVGDEYPIVEHAMWAIDDREILFPKVQEQLKGLDPVKDRVKILKIVMDSGYIRIRDHKAYVAFEFTMDSHKALCLIYDFAKEKLGPFSWMYISNLRTQESYELSFEDFKKSMDEDNPEAILRLAGKIKSLSSRG